MIHGAVPSSFSSSSPPTPSSIIFASTSSVPSLQQPRTLPLNWLCSSSRGGGGGCDDDNNVSSFLGQRARKIFPHFLHTLYTCIISANRHAHAHCSHKSYSRVKVAYTFMYHASLLLLSLRELCFEHCMSINLYGRYANSVNSKIGKFSFKYFTVLSSPLKLRRYFMINGGIMIEKYTT